MFAAFSPDSMWVNNKWTYGKILGCAWALIQIFIPSSYFHKNQTFMLSEQSPLDTNAISQSPIANFRVIKECIVLKLAIQQSTTVNTTNNKFYLSTSYSSGICKCITIQQPFLSIADLDELLRFSNSCITN